MKNCYWSTPKWLRYPTMYANTRKIEPHHVRRLRAHYETLVRCWRVLDDMRGNPPAPYCPWELLTHGMREQVRKEHNRRATGRRLWFCPWYKIPLILLWERCIMPLINLSEIPRRRKQTTVAMQATPHFKEILSAISSGKLSDKTQAFEVVPAQLGIEAKNYHTAAVRLLKEYFKEKQMGYSAWCVGQRVFVSRSGVR